MFGWIQAKATLIIGGIALTAIIGLSGSLWWKANQLERVELKLVNAEQTIVNRDAALLQLHSDIKRQEQAIEDLNTLQDGYDVQLNNLQNHIKELGNEITQAIITDDPVKKDEAIIVIQEKLDDEIVNSYNCLMRASGDLTKECK